MKNRTKELCLMALMTAMVMIAIMCLQIPIPAVNGYVHLGDGIIFISVILLGRKNGALAGALGACLADVITGYVLWAPFSLVIKALMAFVCGKIAEKDKKEKLISPVKLLGIAAAICISAGGYYLVGAMFTGSFASAIYSIPLDLLQGGMGLAIYCALAGIFTPYKKAMGIRKPKA